MVTSTALLAQTQPSTLSGNWQLSCTSKRGVAREAQLQLQQDGSKLGGTLSRNGHSGPLSGSVQGANVSFTAGAGERQFSFTGTVSGNEMTGQNQRGRPCSATRQ